ncbi:hypothetical protein [Streptomyces sp. B6B3]|uniref:hypothetical protein n=1 Tax=Streptomyces sp. B6B3 TaxID=3153570 RepID=UPI00325C3ADC
MHEPAAPPPSACLLPGWMPPRGGTVIAGRDWDGVGVALPFGAQVLVLLGGRSGPCFGARDGAVIVWLVPVGSADGWPGGCRLIRGGEPLALPPPEQWLRPPRRGLTDPSALRAALVRGTTRHG